MAFEAERADRVGRAVVERHGEGLGQVPARLHAAEQRLGERRAAFHAVVPVPDDRRRLRLPGHRHRRAGHEHEHRIRVNVEQRVDQRVLLVRQVHRGAVARLKVVIVVESADEDDRVAARRELASERERLVAQPARALGLRGGVLLRVLQAVLLPRVVLIHLRRPISFGVGDVHIAAEHAVDAEQRRDLVHGLDDGRTAAERVDAVGIRADDEQALRPALVQRQHTGRVLEQHNRFARHVERGLRVSERRVRAGLALGACFAEHVERIHHGKHMLNLAVHVRFAHAAVTHRLEQRAREVIVVEVRRDAHVHVKADFRARLGVLDGAPVGDDEAIEAPFVAQDAVKQRLRFAALCAVDEVVGTHDRQRPALLHGRTEGRQVDLAQRALADRFVHVQAVGLLVVRGEMLGACGHVGFLHAVDDGGALHGGQQRVFAHVFEIAAAQRAAFDVDRGAQNHVFAAPARLLPERFAGEMGERGIPCGGHGRSARQVGHGVARVVPRRPVVVMGVRAHTHRAVVEDHGRDAQPLHALRVEQGGAVDHANLLFERQLGGQFASLRCVGLADHRHCGAPFSSGGWVSQP